MITNYNWIELCILLSGVFYWYFPVAENTEIKKEYFLDMRLGKRVKRAYMAFCIHWQHRLVIVCHDNLDVYSCKYGSERILVNQSPVWIMSPRVTSLKWYLSGFARMNCILWNSLSWLVNWYIANESQRKLTRSSNGVFSLSLKLYPGKYEVNGAIIPML